MSKAITELNPCPFCGKEVYFDWVDDEDMVIRCWGAGCILPTVDLGAMSREQAIKAWNTRNGESE